MSYASLTQFKAYLKIPTGTTSEDTLLQMFLDEADGIIDEIVGVPSAAAAATARVYDDPSLINERTLLFGRADVACAITSVVNGDGTTITSSNYVTLPRGELPIYGLALTQASGLSWDTSDDGVTVTALWAHTTNADGSADALIVGAALQLAAWLYRSKDNVAELSRPVRTEDGTTILPMALPKAVLDRLTARRSLV